MKIIQANLVFCPFTLPALPLGIAIIKAAASQNSDFQVTCFDLNAQWQNLLVDTVRQGKTNIPLKDQLAFLGAVEMFQKGGANFYNQAQYDRLALAFHEDFEMLNDTFARQCEQAFHQRGEVPWYIHKYADHLLENAPDVIGFSLTFNKQFCFSALLAREIKQACPEIKIVFGGNICHCLDPRNLLAQDWLDFIICYEGEQAFPALLRALQGEISLDQVPNLIYQQQGQTIVSEPVPVPDLDAVPFADFSDFDFGVYFSPEPIIPILTSRGCFWRRCTFCDHHSIYARQYRTPSVKRVVDEMEFQMARHGSRNFYFVDEMIPAERFRQLGREILFRGLDMAYLALARPTSEFTPKTFELMAHSGCKYIMWGVESGCRRILDLMDKGTNIEDIAVVLQEAAAAGIKNHVYIIVGFPSETTEEMYETLQFLYENRESIHQVCRSYFVLRPDTLITRDPEKYRITQIHENADDNASLSYEVSQGLTTDQAKKVMAYFSANFFGYFSTYSRALGLFRDHALLIYAHPEKTVYNLPKQPVPEPLLNLHTT
ncbi:MAG: radical SAM protein [Sedimentisphaerales bacterium]|nr:radical SAM protein [Sedimentisphaerales bacterium]